MFIWKFYSFVFGFHHAGTQHDIEHWRSMGEYRTVAWKVLLGETTATTTVTSVFCNGMDFFRDFAIPRAAGNVGCLI
jgi:hypothetical protein